MSYDISKQYSDAICQIGERRKSWLRSEFLPVGSGVFISPKIIITVAHLFDKQSSGLDQKSAVIQTSNGSLSTAGKITIDHELDLAMCTLPKKMGISKLRLPLSQTYYDGSERLQIIGHYNGASLNRGASCVADDLIAKEAKRGFKTFITDGRIGPSSSGSSVVNDRGELVSLVSKGIPDNYYGRVSTFMGVGMDKLVDFVQRSLQPEHS